MKHITALALCAGIALSAHAGPKKPPAAAVDAYYDELVYLHDNTMRAMGFSNSTFATRGELVRRAARLTERGRVLFGKDADWEPCLWAAQKMEVYLSELAKNIFRDTRLESRALVDLAQYAYQAGEARVHCRNQIDATRPPLPPGRIIDVTR